MQINNACLEGLFPCNWHLWCHSNCVAERKSTRNNSLLNSGAVKPWWSQNLSPGQLMSEFNECVASQIFRENFQVRSNVFYCKRDPVNSVSCTHHFFFTALKANTTSCAVLHWQLPVHTFSHQENGNMNSMGGLNFRGCKCLQSARI